MVCTVMLQGKVKLDNFDEYARARTGRCIGNLLSFGTAPNKIGLGNRTNTLPDKIGTEPNFLERFFKQHYKIGPGDRSHLLARAQILNYYRRSGVPPHPGPPFDIFAEDCIDPSVDTWEVANPPFVEDILVSDFA